MIRLLPVAVVLLSAAPLVADMASPPWARPWHRPPDERLHYWVEGHRTALAAVGGGPLVVAQFRHPDGRPLDWERRPVDGPLPASVVAVRVVMVLVPVALVVAGVWAVRVARRSRA